MKEGNLANGRRVISIEVEPVGKPRMTQRDKWKHRPVVDRYYDYADELRAALPHFTLPVELQVTFYLPMPQSWSKRERMAKLGQPHDQKPDIDNLVKGFMDAFKSEDKHVGILRAEKYWSERGFVDVAVTPTDEAWHIANDLVRRAA